MAVAGVAWRGQYDGSEFIASARQMAQAAQSSLGSVTASATAANKALDATGPTADRAAAAQARLKRSTDNFRASIEPLYAAQVRYDRELERANGLLAKGGLTTEQHAAATSTLKARLNEATAALQGSTRGQAEHTAAMGLSRIQVMEYGHVFRSMVDSLIAGQSPIRAVGQELPRIGQAATEGAGGLAALSFLLNPLTLGIIAVADAFALGTAAALSYDSAQRRLAGSIQYGGQASGATVAQMEAIAEAAAKAGKATEGQARAAETAFVTTGRVTSENLGAAVGVLRDFTAATGEKGPAALEELAKALAHPAAGAETLNAKLHFLGQAQLDHIQKLEREGDLAGAQRVILEELIKAVAGAADNVNGLAAAWRHVADGAASAYDWLGRAITRAAAGPSDTQRLGALQQYRAGLQSGKITAAEVIQSGILPAGTQDVGGALNREIGAITSRQAAAQAKAASDTAAARNRDESTAASDIIDKANPQKTQIYLLEQDRTRLQKDLPAAKAGKLPGVTADDVEQGIAGINKQIAEAKRRESAADRRAASTAETAANKASEAERTTRTAVEKAQQEGLQAAIRISAARGEQAKAVLTASASDATLTATERSARIKDAAAALTAANASDTKLKIELDQIEEAKRAAIEQADLNRKLSASQKARIAAAVTAAAKARADAARAEDAAAQTRSETAAKGAGQSDVKTALGIVAGSDAFSTAQRAAAQTRLTELERSEAQARLETILAERGVTEATKAQARAALEIVQNLKPSAAVQDQITTLQRDLLTGAQALATTSQERLKAEQQLLDLAQHQRQAQLEVLLAQLPAGSEALAGQARSAIGAVDAQERQQLQIRNLNPLAKDAYDGSRFNLQDTAIADAQSGLHGLPAALTEAAMKTGNFGSVLESTAQQILQKVLTDILQAYAIAPLEGYLGSAFGGGGGFQDPTNSDPFLGDVLASLGGARDGGRVPGFAKGGLPGLGGGTRARNGRLSGPGTSTSDSILALVDGRTPVRLSTDESIVNAKATRRFWPVIDWMNKAPGYADGGFMGPVGGSLGGGGNVIIHDNRTASDPPPRYERKSNGDHVFSLEKVFKDGIRSNPEAVRDAAMSAPPKVTRRGA